MRHQVCHAHCPKAAVPGLGVLGLIVVAVVGYRFRAEIIEILSDGVLLALAALSVLVVGGLVVLAVSLVRDRGCTWRPPAQVQHARQLARAEALDWACEQIAARPVPLALPARQLVPAIEPPRATPVVIQAQAERVSR